MKISDWFSKNMVFIAILVVAIYILYLILSYNISVGDFNNSFLIGEMFGSFVAIFAIWGFACIIFHFIISLFTKKISVYKLGTSKYTLIMIFIILEVTYLYPLLIKQRERNNSVDTLVNTVATLGNPEKIKSNQAVSPVNQNKNEDALLINKINQAMNTVNLKYENEMNNLYIENKSLGEKMNTIFIPENLITEEGIKNAKLFISEYRKFIQERSSFFTAYQDDLNSEFSKIDIKEFHDSYINSYNRNKAENESLIDSLDSTDNQILDVISKMIELVENNITQVKIINDNIVFNDAVINQKYTELRINLGTLFENEIKILSQIQNKKNETMNEIKEMKQ